MVMQDAELLSLHITYREATFSATAKRLGIVNVPSPEHIENIKALAENIFEPVRAYVGGPVGITSLYRCPALNKAIGGSTTSQHCKGEAMDLDMEKIPYAKCTNAQLFADILMRRPFDQLIWEFGTKKEPDWVHVSYRRDGKNRKQALRSLLQNGATHYIPYTL